MSAVTEFIRQRSKSPLAPANVESCWLVSVNPLKGKKRTGVWKKNLTTDAASGYTNRRDWQSKAMADFAYGQGSWNGVAATGSSATTLTNSGATFPTAGQGLAGRWVVVGPNASGTGSMVMGYIVSNTTTVLTIDQWYSASSTSGAAGTTPNATGFYLILPGQAPAPWIALTSDATAPTAADVALTAELTTNGFARAIGTYAHTAAASTYTLQKTFTATGTNTINNMAIAGAANPTANGVMPFKSAVTSPPTLVSGDTLQITSTITIN